MAFVFDQNESITVDTLTVG